MSDGKFQVELTLLKQLAQEISRAGGSFAPEKFMRIGAQCVGRVGMVIKPMIQRVLTAYELAVINQVGILVEAVCRLWV